VFCVLMYNQNIIMLESLV